MSPEERQRRLNAAYDPLLAVYGRLIQLAEDARRERQQVETAVPDGGQHG